MTRFHSSDWHLGHRRIIELCERPFKDEDHMNHAIIERCNDVVTEDDTLVLHGDNAMGSYADSLPLLNRLRAGNIILLPGNHDRYSLAYGRNHKTSNPEREAREAVKRDEAGAHIYRTLARKNVIVVKDQVPSAWPGQIAGHEVLASHFPYTGDSHGSDRYGWLRPKDEGLPLIHGHVHNEWRENGRMLNVGVDVWDFAPVSEYAIGVWLETLIPQASGGIVVG